MRVRTSSTRITVYDVISMRDEGWGFGMGFLGGKWAFVFFFFLFFFWQDLGMKGFPGGFFPFISFFFPFTSPR